MFWLYTAFKYICSTARTSDTCFCVSMASVATVSNKQAAEITFLMIMWPIWTIIHHQCKSAHPFNNHQAIHPSFVCRRRAPYSKSSINPSHCCQNTLGPKGILFRQRRFIMLVQRLAYLLCSLLGFTFGPEFHLDRWNSYCTFFLGLYCTVELFPTIRKSAL